VILELATAKCPDCQADLKLGDDVLVGEIVTCPECGLDLEVKSISAGRVEVQPVVVEGEDWGE
jgi:alpha-aminoadipate carrier protein LysW